MKQAIFIVSAFFVLFQLYATSTATPVEEDEISNQKVNTETTDGIIVADQSDEAGTVKTDDTKSTTKSGQSAKGKGHKETNAITITDLSNEEGEVETNEQNRKKNDNLNVGDAQKKGNVVKG